VAHLGASYAQDLPLRPTAMSASAAAIALKVLEERGQLQQPYGQRAFAILLFQDMSVVPLLAPLPCWRPASTATSRNSATSQARTRR
jgi:predicted Kef-type K+ transport protein